MVGVPEACSLVPVTDHAKVVGRVDESHGDVEEGESGDACDSASHVFVRQVFAVAVGPFDVSASPPGSVPCATCPVMGLLKFDDFLGWEGGDGSLGAAFRKRFSRPWAATPNRRSSCRSRPACSTTGSHRPMTITASRAAASRLLPAHRTRPAATGQPASPAHHHPSPATPHPTP